MQESYPEDYYDIVRKPWFSKIFTKDSDYEKIEAMEIPHIADNYVNKLDYGCDSKRIKLKATDFPFRLICRLVVEEKNGKKWVATGFFISPKCVITSGHCVFRNKKWVRKIIVIPGANGDKYKYPFGYQTAHSFQSVKGWIKHNSRDFDYGGIILKDDSLFKKIGGALPITILKNSNYKLHNSGYTDKPGERHEQWGDAGKASKITVHRLFYSNNTKKGNSGSPIMIIDKNKIMHAVGIHSYGNCPNYAVRINPNVLKVWEHWKTLQ